MFIIDRSQSVEKEFQDQLKFAIEMVIVVRNWCLISTYDVTQRASICLKAYFF